MRKFAALTAFAAGLTLTALPAAADPVSCSGLPETPQAYVCLVWLEAEISPGTEPENVHVQPVCVALGICTPPHDQAVPKPTLDVPPGSGVALWWNGKCYYVYANGTYSTTPMATPDC
jgi:hypothetical protein